MISLSILKRKDILFIEENNYIDLAKARIKRAKELLEDAEILLERGFYQIHNIRELFRQEGEMLC